jgi:competence protein ComEC
MGFRLILIISIILLTIGKIEDTSFRYSKKPFKRDNSKIWDKQSTRLYDATQIGYKTGMDKELIAAFKRLGIIHLLTPSGIHLASILFVLKKLLSKKIITMLILALFILLSFLSGFYSIKRICIFYILNQKIQSTKYSFILTFLIDLLIGGYANSPLSYALSFMFWGTILFSGRSRVLILINLYICQIISSFFFSSQINLLSIFINPILTSIFSTFFSILSFNYWINFISLLDSLALSFLNYFSNIVIFLDTKLLFATTYISSVFLLIIFIPRKYHLNFICILISLNSINLNNERSKHIRHSYYLKDLDCKQKIGQYGYENKCYFRDIKKAQKIWANN